MELLHFIVPFRTTESAYVSFRKHGICAERLPACHFGKPRAEAEEFSISPRYVRSFLDDKREIWLTFLFPL